jgi:diguanylate cyclase (GGDEF)-like protein
MRPDSLIPAIDDLTGLCGRSRFVETAGLRLKEGQETGAPAALLLLDIDGFHFVNDSLGHDAGDRLLADVAALLRRKARAGDVPAWICADEFALLLTGTDHAQAVELAERLIAEIRGRSEPTVDASVGIATFDGGDDRPSGEDLMIAADIALCEARAAGGGRVVERGATEGGKLTTVEHIRRAIDEEKIVVYAQPILDLRSHTVAREELLVRMLDDDGELIPPSSFLPVAERFGLITEIDRFVLAKAVELAGRSRPIAVNVSGSSLSDPRLIADVGAAIDSGLNPGWLDFEITETAAISNMANARTFAETVTRMGCGLGLDDFGTGFSSLSYLKELPVQHLKIDLEFVRNLCTNTQDQRLVEAIVHFAVALGLETVAEGIEDPETLCMVRQFGVDYAQGFHIGEPVLVECEPLVAAA